MFLSDRETNGQQKRPLILSNHGLYCFLELLGHTGCLHIKITSQIQLCLIALANALLQILVVAVDISRVTGAALASEVGPTVAAEQLSCQQIGSVGAVTVMVLVVAL